MSAADTEPFIHKLGNYLYQRYAKEKDEMLCDRVCHPGYKGCLHSRFLMLFISMLHC